MFSLLCSGRPFGRQFGRQQLLVIRLLPRVPRAAALELEGGGFVSSRSNSRGSGVSATKGSIWPPPTRRGIWLCESQQLSPSGNRWHVSKSLSFRQCRPEMERGSVAVRCPHEDVCGTETCMTQHPHSLAPSFLAPSSRWR